MSALDLARWQFGITTIYHFFFVPMTIGLGLFVATMQTLHYRGRGEVYDRLTRFFGKIFLVSVAVGVVTGIVQEFQFGMNWSAYSRFVGDVFGAPLAIEGLAAFFLESTFIGLWIFGRGRLSPRLHLATIWLTAFGTMLSAYFILAANSWMQHPVGYEIDPVSGRAEMTSIWEVLTNSTLLYAFPHTILAAIATAGMLILGVAAWHFLRGREVEAFRPAARIAMPVVLVAVLATSLIGHFQAQLMTEQQPMKMAAAEALYETQKPAGFSVFAVAAFEKNPGRNAFEITIPRALSLLATNSLDGEVRGIRDIQAEYEQKYGPGDYAPIVGVAYWSFRLMIGAGLAMIAITAWGMWLARRGRLTTARRFQKVAVWGIALPFVANAMGWIFTEMGRQPWVVQGLLKTVDAVSPGVGTTSVTITLAVYTAVYGALAAVAVWIVARIVRSGPPLPAPAPALATERVPDLTLTY